MYITILVTTDSWLWKDLLCVNKIIDWLIDLFVFCGTQNDTSSMPFLCDISVLDIIGSGNDIPFDFTKLLPEPTMTKRRYHSYGISTTM